MAAQRTYCFEHNDVLKRTCSGHALAEHCMGVRGKLQSNLTGFTLGACKIPVMDSVCMRTCRDTHVNEAPSCVEEVVIL